MVNFLFHRKQFETLNGQASSWLSIAAGVSLHSGNDCFHFKLIMYVRINYQIKHCLPFSLTFVWFLGAMIKISSDNSSISGLPKISIWTNQWKIDFHHDSAKINLRIYILSLTSKIKLRSIHFNESVVKQDLSKNSWAAINFWAIKLKFRPQRLSLKTSHKSISGFSCKFCDILTNLFYSWPFKVKISITC